MVYGHCKSQLQSDTKILGKKTKQKTTCIDIFQNHDCKIEPLLTPCFQIWRVVTAQLDGEEESNMLKSKNTTNLLIKLENRDSLNAV